MRSLASAGVVGVALPGLDFAVGHTRPVDCRAIIESGMTLALATDICPGAWLPSMQFVINLACRLYKLSPAEAIRAATLGAAAATDRTDTIGSLEPGKLADVLILDVERHEDLAYRLGRDEAVDRLLLAGADTAPLAGWDIPQLPLKGGEIVARGVSAGPEVARVLRAVEDRWVAEGFPGRERVLELLEGQLTR